MAFYVTLHPCQVQPIRYTLSDTPCQLYPVKCTLTDISCHLRCQIYAVIYPVRYTPSNKPCQLYPVKYPVKYTVSNTPCQKQGVCQRPWGVTSLRGCRPAPVGRSPSLPHDSLFEDDLSISLYIEAHLHVKSLLTTCERLLWLRMYAPPAASLSLSHMR